MSSVSFCRHYLSRYSVHVYPCCSNKGPLSLCFFLLFPTVKSYTVQPSTPCKNLFYSMRKIELYLVILFYCFILYNFIRSSIKTEQFCYFCTILTECLSSFLFPDRCVLVGGIFLSSRWTGGCGCSSWIPYHSQTDL